MIVYGIWTFVAATLAFAISAVTGKFLIPFLHKINFGQTIREEGPKWHQGKHLSWAASCSSWRSPSWDFSAR